MDLLNGLLKEGALYHLLRDFQTGMDGNARLLKCGQGSAEAGNHDFGQGRADEREREQEAFNPYAKRGGPAKQKSECGDEK